MTSAPSLTGKELLSVLKKAGFTVLRAKAVIISFITMMVVLQSCQFTQAKQLCLGCSLRFFVIVT